MGSGCAAVGLVGVAIAEEEVWCVSTANPAEHISSDASQLLLKSHTPAERLTFIIPTSFLLSTLFSSLLFPHLLLLFLTLSLLLTVWVLRTIRQELQGNFLQRRYYRHHLKITQKTIRDCPTLIVEIIMASISFDSKLSFPRNLLARAW